MCTYSSHTSLVLPGCKLSINLFVGIIRAKQKLRANIDNENTEATPNSSCESVNMILTKGTYSDAELNSFNTIEKGMEFSPTVLKKKKSKPTKPVDTRHVT
jgi:hypothetical protein